MRRRTLPVLALVFMCSVLLEATAFAQDPPTGFPPYGSFENGQFDAVNRQNLNVNFAIPVVSSAGRGLNLNFAVVYDSLVWVRSSAWVSVKDQNGNPTWGWKKDLPIGTTKYTSFTERCDSPPPYQSSPHYTNYRFVDPAGTVHPFSVDFYAFATICGFPTGPRTGYATDGSGLYLDATSAQAPIITSPDGKQVIIPAQKDTNGNFLSATVVNSTETDWNDTVGRVALKIISSATAIQYQFLDTGGVYQTTTLKLQSFNIKTNFGCAGVVEYTGTANLPYELDLPNGKIFSFTYEPTPGFPGYYTARLQQVTLPTGGTYQYQYSGANGGINCADGTVTNLTRTISDGASSALWQFARTQNGTVWTTTETAPQLPYDLGANQKVFTFDSNSHETSRQIYQGSATTGTLLRTINTAWTVSGTPASTTTILENNQQSQTQTDFDTFGNLLALRGYAWGTGAPGPLVRTTTLTYLSSSAYTALNIVNRMTRRTVSDATGTVKFRQDVAYDGTSAFTGSNCITGAVQHDDTKFGCSFLTRGNPISVTTYSDPVTPAGGVTKNLSYDSLGNLRQADVDCCQQEQWNFSATTQYAYPDSVVRGASGGAQLTTQAAYNSYTGLLATSTDENGKVTTFTYADPGHLNRLTDIQRPDGNHIQYSYDDTGRTMTVKTPIQGTNQLVKTNSYDTLGRAVKTTISDAAQASYSISETQYDPLSRPYKLSNPHNSTAQYWTTTQFDGLGRPRKAIFPDNSQTTSTYAGTTITVTDPSGKQRKNDVDVLGRLVNVYEPDVNSNNALTQQTSYTYTVLDALATVTQGAQTRTYAYDALNRLTSGVTPESNNQAVSYQYNSFNLLTQRTDARGVITTYGYDTLNRLAQVSYNVGATGVPATPTVSFTYGTDTTQNNKGRLLTMSDGVGSETYSYDVLGRTTQVQKVISGTTYTTVYAYNSAGELTSIQYPSGRTVQPSYDAVGRLSTVASGGPTSPVVSATTRPFR